MSATVSAKQRANTLGAPATQGARRYSHEASAVPIDLPEPAKTGDGEALGLLESCCKVCVLKASRQRNHASKTTLPRASGPVKHSMLKPSEDR